MSTAETTRRGSRPWAATLVVVGVSAAAMISTLALNGTGWVAPPDGIPDAGPLVGWGLPIARLAALLLGVLTVAGLLHAAVMAPQGRNGVVSRAGRDALMRAGWASFAWSGASALVGLLTLSSVLALPISETLTPRILLTYAWDLPPTRVYLLAALLALVLAAGTVLTSSILASTGWLLVSLVIAGLPGLTGHAAGLGDHALAITSGVLHQVAATLWFAGVVALVGAAWRREPGLSAIAARCGTIATWTVAVLVLSGVLSASTRLDSPGQLLSTAYGAMVLAKVVIVIGLLLLAAHLRRRIIPALDDSLAALRRLLLVEIGLLAAALGLAVSLARTPPPRAIVDLGTVGEQLIGYPYPPYPTASTVLLGWHPDAFFLIAALLAGGLYVAGVLRLRARGDRWPVGRTIAWLLGISVMVWATNAGIAAYSPVSFGLHMLQHMSLAMLAPILLVLGGPFTLALRALPPAPRGEKGPRELIVWALHSPLARFFTNPIVVLLIYTVGLYGLYYTPLFGTLMSTHVGHVLMSLHFLLAGYLFYWVIIGVDPLPKPLPHWGKLVLLLVSMVVHSFFALPIMSATVPLAESWFSQVQPPWLADLVADTRLGGGIAWGFGELPALVVLVALSVQWARDDTRKAQRRDRQVARDGDRELDAYNERLARLAAADAARTERESR